MQNHPVVSVVVPIYRMEHCLKRCLDSILAQEERCFELILIDDGSPDSCGQICDQYAQADTRIVVVHQANGGLSAARNVGMERARGTWLTFIDADDWVEPTYLSYLLMCTKAAPKGALIACNHWIDRGGNAQTRFPAGQGVTVYTREEACENVLYHRAPDVSAWAKLYPAEVKEWLSYPIGRLYEDTYVFGDVLQRMDGVVFGSMPQYHYTCIEENATSISKSGFSAHSWDYCDAVEHMTDKVLAMYPHMQNGCTRRRLHAYFSIRRLLVRCPNELRPQRARVDALIKEQSAHLHADPRIPLRDRIALLTFGMGDWAFDLTWGVYQQCRKR